MSVNKQKFEEILKDFFVEIDFSVKYQSGHAIVTFDDGAQSQIDLNKSENAARDAIFILTDVLAGFDASDPMQTDVASMFIGLARTVQICKILADGSWYSRAGEV